MSGRRALLAPDAFKGTLTAAQVAGALAAGAGPDPILCPVADGGEGTAAVLRAADGGEEHPHTVTGPDGSAVEARFTILGDGRTAVVEVASATGLDLVPEPSRDAWSATSRGTGELIGAAIDAGARTVLVGCGGSASTDGGAGALEAFDPTAATIVCLCDTEEPYGRSARVYGPQKGADEHTVRRLDDRLHDQASRLPRDPTAVPWSGAAGGLAGGLWAHGAELRPGATYVLERVGFRGRLAACDLVITGEGRLDRTSLTGKAVSEVAIGARQGGVPCHAVVGHDALDPFSARILDLASIQEAGDLDSLAAAAQRIVTAAVPVS
ncbi:MAG: glycerate kinase family protein [Solirubrobacterales bacterium]